MVRGATGSCKPRADPHQRQENHARWPDGTQRVMIVTKEAWMERGPRCREAVAEDASNEDDVSIPKETSCGSPATVENDHRNELIRVKSLLVTPAIQNAQGPADGCSKGTVGKLSQAENASVWTRGN